MFCSRVCRLVVPLLAAPMIKTLAQRKSASLFETIIFSLMGFYKNRSPALDLDKH